MCVDAHVPGSTSQALVLSVRYMFLSSSVNKLLRETKVYYVYSIVLSARRPTDQEVLRLHVSVDEIL